MLTQVHLYTYDFPIFVDSRAKLNEAQWFAGDFTLRLYPPFRSAPANRHPAPFINWAAVPTRSGHYRWQLSEAPQFAVHPDRADDGRHSLVTVIGEQFEKLPIAYPTDSLRLDVIGLADEVEVEKRAAAVEREVRRTIRFFTRQSWIDRSGSLGSYLKATYKETNSGAQAEEPYSYTSAKTFSEYEFFLDEVIWQKVIQALRGGNPIFDYHDLLMDGFYFARVGEKWRSLLHACQGLEAAKERLIVSSLRYRFGEHARIKKGVHFPGTDLCNHLSVSLKAVIGISFEANPAVFEGIRKIWRFRHKVAHGGVDRVEVDQVSEAEIEDFNLLCLRVVTYIDRLCFRLDTSSKMKLAAKLHA